MMDNQIYNEALRNKDNIHIMAKAASKFKKLIPEDELNQCKNIALWKTIKLIDDRSSFTTYLYNNVRWQCLKYLESEIDKNRPVNIRFDKEDKSTDLLESIDLIDTLENPFRNYVYDYFIMSMNISEISQKYNIHNKTVSRYIKEGLKRIRESF